MREFSVSFKRTLPKDLHQDSIWAHLMTATIVPVHHILDNTI